MYQFLLNEVTKFRGTRESFGLPFNEQVTLEGGKTIISFKSFTSNKLECATSTELVLTPAPIQFRFGAKKYRSFAAPARALLSPLLIRSRSTVVRPSSRSISAPPMNLEVPDPPNWYER